MFETLKYRYLNLKSQNISVVSPSGIYHSPPLEVESQNSYFYISCINFKVCPLKQHCVQYWGLSTNSYLPLGFPVANRNILICFSCLSFSSESKATEQQLLILLSYLFRLLSNAVVSIRTFCHVSNIVQNVTAHGNAQWKLLHTMLLSICREHYVCTQDNYPQCHT